jgi:hypothetical protein
MLIADAAQRAARERPAGDARAIGRRGGIHSRPGPFSAQRPVFPGEGRGPVAERRWRA